MMIMMKLIVLMMMMEKLTIMLLTLMMSRIRRRRIDVADLRHRQQVASGTSHLLHLLGTTWRYAFNMYT